MKVQKKNKKNLGCNLKRKKSSNYRLGEKIFFFGVKIIIFFIRLGGKKTIKENFSLLFLAPSL